MTLSWPAAGTAYYGKYRGLVMDNKDPRNMGRLRTRVPELLADVQTGWAMPSAPYAGDGVGSFTVPEPGAGVWVEFEAGDVSRPIWVGCWWAENKLPKDHKGTAAVPAVKIVRTDKGLLAAFDDGAQSIAISDEQGTNLLTIDVQGGKITIKGASKAIVEAPQIELVENASHPVVFGDELMTYLQQLVTQLQTHMHPGQTALGLPVTPAPPVPPPSPPTPSLLSQKVKAG